MKKRKIAAIIQARITSTRLPGKVLMDIEGKPMLWHVINRLKLSKKINEIILAIPNTKENDILEKFAKDNKVKYFKGSEEDVLSRYYEAAKEFKSDIVVRITSDCPLIDPQVVDLVIEKHLNSGADYTSNVLQRTFPRGLDVEVFNFKVLEKTQKEARKNYQREHVTPYICENPKIFKLQNIKAKGKLRRPELRLTVDTKEDLKLIREIYRHLYKLRKIFYTEEIIDLFNNHQELIKINEKVRQKNWANEIMRSSNISIRIRKANFSDVEFLWYLRNQPDVYRYFKKPKRVSWEEHIKWIVPIILRMHKKNIFIIENDSLPIGQIRFDYDKEKRAQMSISLLKEFRGKGIATQSFKKAIKILKKEKKIRTFFAEVHKDNTFSQKFFENLNFKLTSKKKNWFKYILELK